LISPNSPSLPSKFILVDGNEFCIP
jgi:hypothetical protein